MELAEPQISGVGSKFLSVIIKADPVTLILGFQIQVY